MRVLVISGDTGERKRIKEHLRKLPYTQYDDRSKLEIHEEKTGMEAFTRILADYDRLTFYDLLVTAQSTEKLTGLALVKKLVEDQILSSMQVIVFCEAIERDIGKTDGVPGVAAFLETPVEYEAFKTVLTSMTDRMVAAEEAKRAEAIEELMSTKEQKDFLLALENIYMQSARNIMNCKIYAPWSHTPYESFGRIYIGCNMYEKAIPALKKAIEIRFDLPDVHRNLVLCYKRTGRSFEELEELKEMALEEPASSTVQLKLGDAYLREGEYEKGADCFKKAIEYHKPSESNRIKAKSHVGLGRSYVAEGEVKKDATKYEMAKDEFDIAVSVDPMLVAAYGNLVIVYKKMGRYDDAQNALAKAMRIMPDDAEGWLALFEVYLVDGEVGKAKTSLQKALKYDPENQMALCSAGEMYMREKMFEEAIELFEKALEVNPSDARLYNYLGICFRRLNNGGRAIEFYLKVLAIHPDDAVIYYNLGKAYYQEKRHVEAGEAFSKALEYSPHFPEARRALELVNDIGGDDQRRMPR